jgi:hypothetical protein
VVLLSDKNYILNLMSYKTISKFPVQVVKVSIYFTTSLGINENVPMAYSLTIFEESH